MDVALDANEFLAEDERLNAELKALDPKGTSPDLDAQAQQMLRQLFGGQKS